MTACLSCFVIAALSGAALAQENPMPVTEVGGRWVYNNLETTPSGGWSNQNGGSIYGQYFFKQTHRMWHGRSMLGIVGEFSGSGSASGNLYTYLFGPRIGTEWRKSHLVFHAEFKIGGDHVRVNGVTPAGSNASVARNGFTWGIADGLDVVVARHYVVTPFQIEFLDIDVPQTIGGGHWEADMRLSAGIGFRFGQR